MTEFVNTYHLDVSPASLKLYFHSHDTDLDRELSLRDFRRFLESFVAYSSTDEGEDSDSEHEEDDEVKTTEGHGHGGGNHMEGWSESKKKWYGIWLLLFGTGMVAIFSDPMIEVVGAFGNKYVATFPLLHSLYTSFPDIVSIYGHLHFNYDTITITP